MIREHLFHKRAPADPMFRWRGGEISRLEGLSDGVFAVTLTLLIVSVNVPTTFYELWRTIRDIPVFLASFVLLMMACPDAIDTGPHAPLVDGDGLSRRHPVRRSHAVSSSTAPSRPLSAGKP